MSARRFYSASAVLLTVVTGSTFAASAVPPTQPDPATRTAETKADATQARARTMAEKAIAYLRSKQNSATGGWSTPPEGSDRPAFPAVTALVLTGMRMNDSVAADDPTAIAGLKYLLNHVQPDGGIYDRILPSYNTSIALSALAHFPDSSQARAAIKPAQDFLRGLQYSESSSLTSGGNEAPVQVDRSHAFYGGVGYGNHGRPDLSNLGFMLQGLHDTGIRGDDPAFQRALVFLSRVQMLDSVNDMAYADGSKQGGFIYATASNKDTIGAGQSQAGTMAETLDDGTNVSRLRSYGSMTYTGFKSLIYADLPRDDERVRAALGWLGEHYTVDENPGMGMDGYYYYVLAMARALDAWGDPLLEAEKDGESVHYDWQKDLVEKLATLQNDDGSFRPLDDRWMESDPVLITAYTLIALQEIVD